jgi:hypothetical protein
MYVYKKFQFYKTSCSTYDFDINIQNFAPTLALQDYCVITGRRKAPDTNTSVIDTNSRFFVKIGVEIMSLAFPPFHPYGQQLLAYEPTRREHNYLYLTEGHEFLMSMKL